MNKEKKDLIIVIIVTLLISIISLELDIFEHIINITDKYEEYELDEIFLIILISPFTLTWYIFRRINDIKVLNHNLEDRIKIEVEKSKKQQEMLVQQNKFASMGEMIRNIAHQWRQPLNALSLLIQNVEIKYNNDDLNSESISKMVEKGKYLTKSMSQTIDDFMFFFNPKNKNESFYISEIIDRTITIFKTTNLDCQLELNNSTKNTKKINGNKNGLTQVLLNLLTNANDSFKNCDKCSNSLINFNIREDKDILIIEVEDFGGGIKDEIKEKIFEPYFTTKFKSQGTGLGLYMSKVIIEEYMGGKLSLIDKKDGALFKIELPYNKEV